MLLVDTHSHLDDSRFDSDRVQVVQHALDEGVHRILTVGTDLASSLCAIELAREFDAIRCAVGVHPSRAGTLAKDEDAIRAMATESEVCAIGEIGLDYYWHTGDRETQMITFRRQLDLASELDLPVIVHDREAHEDTLEMLKNTGARGVLHCFSGDVAFAREAVGYGLHISLAGNVTYKSAENLHAVAREVPLERLLLETDSPYLAPQDWRGKRNEPSHVSAVAAKVAELRGVPVEEVASRTTENAVRLFAWN